MPMRDDGSLTPALERRSKATERIINALAHLTRESAMRIIMSNISIADLEQIADFQERRN